MKTNIQVITTLENPLILIPSRFNPLLINIFFYFYLDSLVLSVPHIINLIFLGLIYFLCCGDIWLLLLWGDIALYECTLLHLSIPLVRTLGLFLGLGFYGYLPQMIRVGQGLNCC